MDLPQLQDRINVYNNKFRDIPDFSHEEYVLILQGLFQLAKGYVYDRMVVLEILLHFAIQANTPVLFQNPVFRKTVNRKIQEFSQQANCPIFVGKMKCFLADFLARFAYADQVKQVFELTQDPTSRFFTLHREMFLTYLLRYAGDNVEK